MNDESDDEAPRIPLPPPFPTPLSPPAPITVRLSLGLTLLGDGTLKGSGVGNGGVGGNVGSHEEMKGGCVLRSLLIWMSRTGIDLHVDAQTLNEAQREVEEKTGRPSGKRNEAWSMEVVHHFLRQSGYELRKAAWGEVETAVIVGVMKKDFALRKGGTWKNVHKASYFDLPIQHGENRGSRAFPFTRCNHRNEQITTDDNESVDTAVI